MAGWPSLGRSVFVKFSAAFIVVGLIPLFALSYFSLRTFSGHVERNTVNNLEQMVLYMSYNLNNVFSDYDDISQLMYFKGSSVITNQSAGVNEQERINQIPIDDFLSTILFGDPYIRNVFFVRSLDGKLYTQTKDNKALLPDRLPLEKWREPLRERPRHLAIIPTHEEDYYVGSEAKVMTIGRNLIDTSGRIQSEPDVIGTLYFDVDLAVMDDLFLELNLNKKDELYVRDGGGGTFFANREPDAVKAKAAGASPSDKLTFRQEIPYLGGEVVIRLDKAELYEQLSTTRTTVIVAIVICSLALAVTGAWFSRRFSAPIRSVIRQMVKVESGNFDVQAVKGGRDEIGRLAHGFNRMVERLKAYIDEAYVAQIKQKQTELNALKSQIRPHYLYNTLEVIRMNAVHSEAGEVGDMILSLSNQLKYVIDYGEELVTIERELEHLTDYFYIIRVRFENRIELRCELSGEVNPAWLMPKLSLQPLVENAVQHGIRPKGGKGSVLVSIEREGEAVAVTVIDDGVGMEPGELSLLENKLSDPQAPASGIGLKNVHERLKTLYGPSCGLAVGSRKHVGTSVKFIIPVREGGIAYGDTGRIGR